MDSSLITSSPLDNVFREMLIVLSLPNESKKKKKAKVILNGKSCFYNCAINKTHPQMGFLSKQGTVGLIICPWLGVDASFISTLQSAQLGS